RDDARGHYVVSAAPGLGYEYRWDADADGKPDSPDFSAKTSVEIVVSPGETRSVRLEVKNAFGRVGASTITLARPKMEQPTAMRDSAGGSRLASGASLPERGGLP